MAGTASTMTEYTDPAEQQRLINRLSQWIFGQNDTIYRDCRLIDISECGGALLIPKELVIPHHVFDLIIHSSDDSKTSSISVRAELRWSDIDYSDTHIKIGFRFENNSLSKKRAIQNLMNISANKDEVDFDCSLIF
jgi:c-di-GMP-binding flagellar brake protein YcgR